MLEAAWGRRGEEEGKPGSKSAPEMPWNYFWISVPLTGVSECHSKLACIVPNE